MNTHTLQKAGW